MLEQGFIRLSSSPAASQVRNVHKEGDGVRQCINYVMLNDITIPDRGPLPQLEETFRLVAGAKIFSKLDISAAFHRIRIAKGDEWKTAFTTRFGLFEWTVVPFGLRNAPAHFQRYINMVLAQRLGVDVAAYMDDILVYSNSVEEHRRTVRWVMKQLIKYGLPADPKKSEFEKQELAYLGRTLHAGKGVGMVNEKAGAIAEYLRPQCVTGVRRFLGMANEYRNFIPHYAEVMHQSRICWQDLEEESVGGILCHRIRNRGARNDEVEVQDQLIWKQY